MPKDRVRTWLMDRPRILTALFVVGYILPLALDTTSNGGSAYLGP